MAGRIVVASFFLWCWLAAAAAPSPWYTWKSRSGASACAQTTPGEGWLRQDGPYKDSRCTQRITERKSATT